MKFAAEKLCDGALTPSTKRIREGMARFLLKGIAQTAFVEFEVA